MTEFNLNDKIHVVDTLFSGEGIATRVLLSEKAQAGFEKLRKKKREEYRRFLGVLQRYAKAGFQHFESKKGPIKHEGKDIYRVAHRDTLFRLIGFFENDRRESFIGIDTFTKLDTQLTGGQKDRIKAVARVKKFGLWRLRGA